ncbi:hypothetical protein GG344DRAFT_63966 [Lentinula edodes]|nr:hypothetical protein GG344DRAFT_63966 [Lentinula edodes]
MSEATSVLEIIPPDSSQHDASLIILFFVLQLIGLVGSIFTIVIAHFSLIRRHLTWYNFLASWIISSLSYSLLLFAGQIDLSGEKKSEFRRNYAGYGGSDLVQCAFDALQEAYDSTKTFDQNCISTEALVFGLIYPDSVRVTGSGMYCNSGLAIPIFGILALGLSLFFFFTIHHGAALNIVIAFIPVMAVFTFASQKDLLEVWMFRKWRKKGSSSVFVHARAMAESDSTLGGPVSVYNEKDLPPLPA